MVMIKMTDINILKFFMDEGLIIFNHEIRDDFWNDLKAEDLKDDN